MVKLLLKISIPLLICVVVISAQSFNTMLEGEYYIPENGNQAIAYLNVRSSGDGTGTIEKIDTLGTVTASEEFTYKVNRTGTFVLKESEAKEKIGIISPAGKILALTDSNGLRIGIKKSPETSGIKLEGEYIIPLNTPTGMGYLDVTFDGNGSGSVDIVLFTGQILTSLPLVYSLKKDGTFAATRFGGVKYYGVVSEDMSVITMTDNELSLLGIKTSAGLLNSALNGYYGYPLADFNQTGTNFIFSDFKNGEGINYEVDSLFSKTERSTFTYTVTGNGQFNLSKSNGLNFTGIVSSDGKIYVMADNQTNYELGISLSDTLRTGIEDDSKIKNEFYLSQNYPNPFNPVTGIKFTIPNVVRGATLPNETTLVVYDILGRKIKTLVNKNLTPGNYELEFNAETLSSGVYFYKLSYGSYSIIKKMILLK